MCGMLGVVDGQGRESIIGDHSSASLPSPFEEAVQTDDNTFAVQKLRVQYTH